MDVSDGGISRFASRSLPSLRTSLPFYTARVTSGGKQQGGKRSSGRPGLIVDSGCFGMGGNVGPFTVHEPPCWVSIRWIVMVQIGVGG